MRKNNYILCFGEFHLQKPQYVVPARQAKGKPGSDARQQAGGRLKCPLSDMGQGLFLTSHSTPRCLCQHLGKAAYEPFPGATLSLDRQSFYISLCLSGDIGVLFLCPQTDRKKTYSLLNPRWPDGIVRDKIMLNAACKPRAAAWHKIEGGIDHGRSHSSKRPAGKTPRVLCAA